MLAKLENFEEVFLQCSIKFQNQPSAGVTKNNCSENKRPATLLKVGISWQTVLQDLQNLRDLQKILKQPLY